MSAVDRVPRGTFDPQAAVRIFRERWTAGLMEVAFGPFIEMVDSLEKTFIGVPMAKKQPKNKAKVFRIAHSGRLFTYQAKVKASKPSAVYLQQTLDTVLILVNEAHPSYYEDVRDRFVEVMQRWVAALPCKLIGRDEEAILEYVDIMQNATEECAMAMLDCEERMAQYAAKTGVRIV